MTYASEVLADNPLLYWKLDETAGATTVVDASPNGRNGTVTSGWTFAQTPEVTGSSFGSKSNGSGRITSPTVAFGAAQVTLEAWAYIDTSQSYMLFSFGVNHLNIYIDSGKLGVNTGTGDNYGCSVLAGLHHVVAIMPNAAATTNAIIYIDGALQVLSGTSGTAPSLASTTLKISGWNGTGKLIPNGYYVDEIAVYSGALSAARAQAHFDAGAVVSTRIMSRLSVAVLINDANTNRVVSRQSIAVLVSDAAVQRVASRVSVAVLTPTKSRYRGWGVER